MNNETAEWLAIIGVLILLVLAICLIATLPFAFLGWIILSFINILGAGLMISYFNCAITGIMIALIVGLTAK